MGSKDIEKQLKGAFLGYKEKMSSTRWGQSEGFRRREQCIAVAVFCNLICQYYEMLYDTEEDVKKLMFEIEEKATYDTLTAVQRKFVIPG